MSGVVDDLDGHIVVVTRASQADRDTSFSLVTAGVDAFGTIDGVISNAGATPQDRPGTGAETHFSF